MFAHSPRPTGFQGWQFVETLVSLWLVMTPTNSPKVTWWYLSKLILRWCTSPTLSSSLRCFWCLRIQQWPRLTWPRSSWSSSVWMACQEERGKEVLLEHWLFREAFMELKTFLLDILKVLYYWKKICYKCYYCICQRIYRTLGGPSHVNWG